MASSSIAPIFLRAALAVTFLWAGFGKVLETMPVSGVEAAALANMGVVTPEVAKPVKPASTAAFFPSLPILALVQPPVVSEPKPDQAPPPPAVQNYSAADFPQPIQVRRLHGITLMVLRAASPHTDEQGTPRTQLLPSRLGDGNIPVYMAWAAALTEIIAGLFVMVGLLTRVSALALAATMVGAIWLTEIGPAIQSGQTVFGLLPAYGAYSMDSAGKYKFTMLLWQCSLLCSAMALAFTGPGFVSFDRALFPSKVGGRRDVEEDD